MTKKRSFVLVIFLSSALPLTAAAFGAERTETKAYYVGSDLQPVCSDPTLPDEVRDDQRIGGACFDLQGDEIEASIVVDDVTGLPIGSAYSFESASGNAIGGLNLFCESTTAQVPAGAARLNVYVAGPIVSPIVCLLEERLGGTGTTGNITVTYQLGVQGDPPPLDEERDCFEAVPESIGVSGVTDQGQNVNLEVKVLLDGVSLARGQAVFVKAAESYAPLGIDMIVTNFESVTFTGNNAQGLINQARDHEGGQRPTGTDVVYTLTDKDIELAPAGDAVVGLADCIGGVRYPERAFAVGEDIGDGFDFGPITFTKNATAKTAVHEIGHLMGAHHHYANCVEGATTIPEENGPSACTVMFNALDFLSAKFGILEGIVVRGHAVDFASP